MPAERQLVERPGALPVVDSRRPEAGRGYSLLDLIVLPYLALITALLVFSPLTCSGRVHLTAVNLALLISILALRYLPRSGHWLLLMVRGLYPLAIIPFFYETTQQVNRLVTTRYFDAQIASWEEAIFGAQVSQVFANGIAHPIISELLHLCYLLYIPTVVGLTILLFTSRRKEIYESYAASVVGTFIICYTIFIFVPVKGPYHHFGPLAAGGSQGSMAGLVARMLENSSSIGTAFPSSHVAVSVCAYLASRRAIGRWSYAMFFIIAGIFIGTVYGGFHYAIDSLVGLIVGVTTGILGPRLVAAVQGHARRAAA